MSSKIDQLKEQCHTLGAYVASKNLSSKGWGKVAILTGSTIFIGLSTVGIIALLKSFNVIHSVPGFNHAIGTIGHSQVPGIAMTAGGVVVGASLVILGLYLVHRYNQTEKQKNTSNVSNDNPPPPAEDSQDSQNGTDRVEDAAADRQEAYVENRQESSIINEPPVSQPETDNAAPTVIPQPESQQRPESPPPQVNPQPENPPEIDNAAPTVIPQPESQQRPESPPPQVNPQPQQRPERAPSPRPYLAKFMKNTSSQQN